MRGSTLAFLQLFSRVLEWLGGSRHIQMQQLNKRTYVILQFTVAKCSVKQSAHLIPNYKPRPATLTFVGSLAGISYGVTCWNVIF